MVLEVGALAFEVVWRSDAGRWGVEGVSVPEPSSSGTTGYKYISIAFPAEMQLNCVLPSGWSRSVGTSTDSGVTTAQISVAAPNTQGTAAQVKAFFEAEGTSLTLKDTGEYPSCDVPCTIALDPVRGSGSGPIRWVDPEGYVHYYGYISSYRVRWLPPFNAARQRVLGGTSLRGYLATDTGIEEQRFIYGNVSRRGGWSSGTRATSMTGARKINNMVPANTSATINSDAGNYHVGDGDASAQVWYWADGAEDPRGGWTERGLEFFWGTGWEWGARGRDSAFIFFREYWHGGKIPQ